MLHVILENFEPTQLLLNVFISFLKVGDPVFEELDEFIMNSKSSGEYPTMEKSWEAS